MSTEVSIDLVRLTQNDGRHDPHVFHACETHVARLFDNDRCQRSYRMKCVSERRSTRKEGNIRSGMDNHHACLRIHHGQLLFYMDRVHALHANDRKYG